VVISTQLDVSNQGTGPALKVSQYGVGDDQDVAVFNAGLEGDALKIDSSGNMFVYKDMNVSGINITGVLELGSITDVEQKIIDVSNNAGGTSFITYVDDKLVVEKDMDLSINNLTFNKGVIQEVVGTTPSATGGSLTLEHNNPGGSSSIVFISKVNQGSDHGYISYKDDILGDSGSERSLLEIGVKNDRVGGKVDNIALMPSGFVGVNTQSPGAMLDVNGDIDVNGKIILDTEGINKPWTMSTKSSLVLNQWFYYLQFQIESKLFFITNRGVEFLNFTGQHRCFIKDLPFSNTEVYAGRIVCADQNTNISMSGSIKKGNKAITQNETLPYVSLSTKNKDKSCFGIISDSEDPNERVDKYGGFCTLFEKEKGDTRVYINSVGEGAIWVSNKDGPLESGDYITTCDLLGYGAKQSDDILHNYSVAKITMDCDFNPRYVPRPTILKDASGENILDPYEQIQWTDEVDSSGNVVYEYEYNIRYINSDAQIITYEEYMDNSNNSYIIAYVGCTYHCG